MSFEFLLEKNHKRKLANLQSLRNFMLKSSPQVFYKGVVHKFNKKKEFSMKSGVCLGVL